MDNTTSRWTRLKSWLSDTWPILLITGLGTALRLAATPASLPYLYTPGESIVVRQALAYGSGNLKPYTLLYPPLYSYIMFGLYGLYFLLGRLVGRFVSVSEFAISYFANPTPFYLIGRVLTALLGGATIWVTYLLAKRAYNKRVGLLAGAFIAVSHLHVVHSHNVLTDVPMTFLVTVVAWATWRALERDNRSDWWWAGVTVGLAAGMKYTAVVSAVLVITAVIIRAAQKRAILQPALDLAISGVAALFAFIVTCPYALLDPQALYADLITTQLGMNQGIAKPFGESIGFYLSTLFRSGLEPLLAGVAVLGVLYLLIRHRATDLLLAVFSLLYLIFLGIQGRYQPNWLLPMLPILCIAAGVALADAVDRWLPAKRQPLALALAALVLTAYPAWYSYFHVRSSYNPDTRTLAKEWVEANIPSGTKILLDSGTTGPPLEQTVDSFQRYFRETGQAKEIDRRSDEAQQAFGSYEQYQLEAARRRAASEIAYDIEYMQAAWWRASEQDSDMTEFPVFGLYRERIFTLAQLREAGVRYVIVSSFQYRKYLTDEGRTQWPSYYQFYRSLDEQAELVQSFQSDPIHQPGPDIKIYALRKSAP